VTDDNYRVDQDAGARLMTKLRHFIESELDDDERALLAALLAPGIAQAYEEVDVAGYTATVWAPDALPHALVRAIREKGVRVQGLGLEAPGR
jgi:hypothetical protein